MKKNNFEVLSEKVTSEAVRKGLIECGDKILVAFSGGADSLLLLCILDGNKEKTGIEVIAGHLNHGIRGKEAVRDEEFCRDFCKERKIPFVSGHVDVPSEAKKSGEGIEECARRMRYSFLQTVASENGCTKIATAHHADDNIETVLLHLTRGSGLRGLCGIHEKRDNIIRPLLGVKKSDILGALEEIGQEFVSDSTNNDLEVSRNLLRHTVLPKLYRINSGADRAFLNMSRSVSEDEKYLMSQTDKIPANADLKTLKELPDALLTRYIRRKYDEYFGKKSHPLLGYDTTSVISDFIKNGEGTKKYPLPGGVSVYIGSFGMEIISGEKKECPDYFEYLKDGENDFSPYGYRIFTTFDKNVANELKNIYKLSISASVSSDKISIVGLAARNRRAGDEYVFGGYMRSVRRQLVKFKIPEFKRETLPVVTSGDDIIWVPGLPVSDTVKPGKDEKIMFIIYCPEQ